MTKRGTKSLTEAYKKGISITFRGEPIKGDLFICRAEWKEGDHEYIAHGKRFRCLSDRKADYRAEEIMLELLNMWSKTEPNQSLQTTIMAVTDAAAQPPRQP
jgi:hypothetical protein